ncbi:MAG: sulfotransferase [Pseudomonadota bacterium]
MTEYGFFSRALHRLTLDSKAIARASFELDQAVAKTDISTTTNQKHVFVSGLARSATTVLLTSLFETGTFSTLTYRDMPFVLMPNIWRRLSRFSKRSNSQAERAHGDGILIGFDSPEAFEEVFWRVFYSDHYLFDDHIGEMDSDESIVQDFRKYIASLLAGESNSRYLSKNNNNIVRLPAIRSAFPNSVIIVPFREPLQHALSLKRQHEIFSRKQEKDSFVRDYMTWLGHHEFGLDHRPFRFYNDTSPKSADSFNYWLALWKDVYQYLDTSAPKDTIFVSYEVLCSQTNEVLSALADEAHVSWLPHHSDRFTARTRDPGEDFEKALVSDCQNIYERLTNRMRRSLNLS